jgi:hypothetical protein
MNNAMMQQPLSQKLQNIKKSRFMSIALKMVYSEPNMPDVESQPRLYGIAQMRHDMTKHLDSKRKILFFMFLHECLCDSWNEKFRLQLSH